MISKNFPGTLVAAAILGTCGIWGCANTKPPADMITQTEAEIDKAKDLGAQEHAPVELLDAEDKLAKAKTAVNEEQYAKAEKILEKALVDAEYAAVKSQSAKAKSAASTVDEGIETLRQETLRGQDSTESTEY
jgi:outer membrane murein-binding lipoprotein Lpp